MKCMTSVKIAEPAKPEPKWEFPCFGRSNDGKIYWFVDDGLSRDELCGMDLADGDCSRTWAKDRFTPVPKEESKNWRVVIDAAGVRLEKGGLPEPVKADENPDCLKGAEFPGLFRHPSTGNRTLLLAFAPPEKAIPDGIAINGADGSIRSDCDCRSRRDWEQCAGSVTITNRPGVEFPRLYRMCGRDSNGVAMRTAPDMWWDLRGGVLERFPATDSDGGTDYCRLHVRPVDTPLPDGQLGHDHVYGRKRRMRLTVSDDQNAAVCEDGTRLRFLETPIVPHAEGCQTADGRRCHAYVPGMPRDEDSMLCDILPCLSCQRKDRGDGIWLPE